MAITRNASESLENAQYGVDLKRGDEVLTTNQDYPRMLTTFRQRERREGIKLKTISFPVPAPDMDDLYRRFEQAVDQHEAVDGIEILACLGDVLALEEQRYHATSPNPLHAVGVALEHALEHLQVDEANVDLGLGKRLGNGLGIIWFEHFGGPARRGCCRRDARCSGHLRKYKRRERRRDAERRRNQNKSVRAP